MQCREILHSMSHLTQIGRIGNAALFVDFPLLMVVRKDIINMHHSPVGHVRQKGLSRVSCVTAG